MSVLTGVALALRQILAHKLKSFFSLVGVIIGITFLIAVVTIVEGMNDYVKNDFAGSIFGINTFSVVRWSRQGRETAVERKRRARNPQLDYHDVEVVQAAVPDAWYLSYSNDRFFREVWAGQRKRNNVRVIGASPPYQSIQGWEVAEGRGLLPLDERRSMKVAVIGPEISQKLFPDGRAVGRRIRLGAYRFTVVGVFKRKGGLIGNIWDAAILLPYSTYDQTLSRSPGHVEEINVKMRTAGAMDTAMSAVEGALRSDRGLRPAEDDNFGFRSSSDLLNFWSKINRILLTALPGLVSISLVVGGIVIMNIMLVSVSQRTKEIGISKAMGARRRDILLQFLAEASTLSLLGSALGIGLGVGLARIVAATTPLPAAVPVWALVLAPSLGIVVGLASGMYPAYRAARLNPIDALRWE